MDNTFNQVFINLHFSVLLPFLYSANHGFWISFPFDVLSYCFLYNDITITQGKMRNKFIDVLTRLELYLFRQKGVLPSWLTNTRSQRGTKDRI